MELVIHTLVSAGMLYVASKLVDGIEVNSALGAIVGALVLGVVNWVVWAVFAAILLPLTILTLGLFALVVNAFALKFTAAVVRGFEIRTFKAALMGAVVIGLINLLLGFLFGG